MQKSCFPPPTLPGQSLLFHTSPTLRTPLTQTFRACSSRSRTELFYPSTTTVYRLPLRSSNPIQLSSSTKCSTLLFFGRKGQVATALELGFEGNPGLVAGVGDGLGDGLSGAFAGAFAGAFTGPCAGAFAGAFAGSFSGAFALFCSMAPILSPP
jgi:hypothetical protein